MSIENSNVSKESSSNLNESATRRRGAVLENALLEAAWAELLRLGFGAFTIEGVAARSGTSRTVIYRRWATRPELAVAAVRHYLETHPVAIPDTGNLRQDLVEYMVESSIGRGDFLGFFTGVGMQGYFKETHSSLFDFRRELLPSETAIDKIYRRAIERGEINPQKLSSRVASLPFDLLRQEAFMSGMPVPRSAIEEIVDQIFLPLVRV